MDFIRGQNTPYFSWDFDLKIWFRGPLSDRDFRETGPRSENGCAKSHVLIWNRPGSRESGGRYSHKAFLGVPAGGPAQARGDMWFSIFSRKMVNWKKYRIYSEVLKLVFSRETKYPSRKFRTLSVVYTMLMQARRSERMNVMWYTRGLRNLHVL